MKPHISFTIKITSEEYTRVRKAGARFDRLVLDKLTYVRRAATPELVERMFMDDNTDGEWTVR